MNQFITGCQAGYSWCPSYCSGRIYSDTTTYICSHFGKRTVSKNLILLEWDKLWTINKKIVDPICGRHTAVLKEKCVLLTLSNGPDEPFVRILPRHKKYEGAGKKATTFANRIWLEYADASVVSVGEEVTLMDWGNAIIREIKTDNGTVTQLVGELHLEGSVKMTKLKLTWLSDIEDLVSLSLVDFDYLINKKKVRIHVLSSCW